ncbi:hypothetical protein SAMN04487944_11935 [Gracilibacillus ureilyticus]|uniref:Uncharacterized protein n=1 Tax=Gracilibacillus ureilyticus TaxID=531814 RepID=A0A1H9USU0_9BACI|nr:hypothetical protein [Gracilibacillus ureilyticus]SES12555.1 hypothetical protein SAMN04487944_11935 [Gracilibacillus ureilyticus]
MYKLTHATLFISACLLLFGCGSKTASIPDTHYINGFPVTETPALSEFLNYLNTDYAEHQLMQKKDIRIFSQENWVSDDPKQISYYQYTNKQLLTYYRPIFNASNPSIKLNELRNNEEKLHLNKSIGNLDTYNLPKIEMTEQNQLKIQTSKNQKTIQLNEELERYGVTNDTNFHFTLGAINENNLLIILEDTDKANITSEQFYLFIDQQLANFTITQFQKERANEFMESGELEPYYDLFPKTGDFISVFGTVIVNTETNKVTPLQDEDLLSKDGKFVYLGGDMKEPSDDLEDGVQRIQTIENYTQGNEVYEEEFSIDYGEISDQLDFDTKNIITADIVYFNEDYVVLTLLYAGRLVGHGGETNVLIDLQDEENPQAYMVNLGLQ